MNLAGLNGFMVMSLNKDTLQKMHKKSKKRLFIAEKLEKNGFIPKKDRLTFNPKLIYRNFFYS